MLKRTLLMLMVAASLCAAAIVPTASARSVAARAADGPTQCLPGSDSSNYCQKHCWVPELVGDSVRQAVQLLEANNCRLGKVVLVLHGSESEVTLNAGQFALFAVRAQLPGAGAVRPDGWRVDILVKFAG